MSNDHMNAHGAAHDHKHEHEHNHAHAHTHITYTNADPARECDGDGHRHHHHDDGSCCCEQHAKEFHGIDKPMLTRLIFSALCYAVCLIFPLGETFSAALLILCAVSAGYDIVYGAIKNLFKGKVFDEYFLMSFAAIAAFIIGEYKEGAAVLLLYRIGTFCQSYAIRHSRRAIAEMTGGHVAEASTAASNRFITRFSRIYTPVILAVALLIAVILPLTGDTPVKDAVYRALTFLVLACPCGIVISVPMTYFAGIAAAARSGACFRDSAALDSVAKHSPNAESIRSVCTYDKKIYTYDEQPAEDAQAAMLVMESPEALSAAIAAAKTTRLIAHENVWFFIVVKLAVLVLAALGTSPLWFAVFADSGVTVIMVLNALRAFRIRKLR
ncbi:MAG: hypothetical protein E7472_02485 [Ruminococcaceae bacterium]|nr:hypothetical protein [Oscillospiraceae bacterium]